MQERAVDPKRGQKLVGGKVVLVTAAAHPAGLEVTKKALKEGASVAMLDEDEELLADVLENLSPKGRILTFAGSPSDGEFLHSALCKCSDELGVPDIFIPIHGAHIGRRSSAAAKQAEILGRMTSSVLVFGQVFRTFIAQVTVVEVSGRRKFPKSRSLLNLLDVSPLRGSDELLQGLHRHVRLLTTELAQDVRSMGVLANTAFIGQAPDEELPDSKAVARAVLCWTAGNFYEQGKLVSLDLNVE